jgi:signal transduction histidine kinase
MGIERPAASPSTTRVSDGAALFVIVCGALNIIGWLTGNSLLKDPFGTNFMAPNTALCFITSGLALVLANRGHRLLRGVALLLAACVTAFAILTVLEYLTGHDFGIDRIFLENRLGDWTKPNVLPGRFAPQTALAFSLIGPALLFGRLRTRHFRVSELLAIPVLLIGFLSLIGYAYRVEPLYGISDYSSMALHTAFCLAALAIGLLWSAPEHGIMTLVLGADAGGVTARRLLMAVIFMLPLLGWVQIRVQAAGLLNFHLGVAFFVLASVIIFSVLILRTARKLGSLDEQRKAAERSLLQSHAELESLVARRTEALRQLSARLLRLQDQERRRIARELHDSVGQYLAALKINCDLLSNAKGDDAGRVIADTRRLLDQCIGEIRTLSYLLHPPVLDEAGINSAAQWYIEGFSKRSGVQVSLDLQCPDRLPAEIELMLFRVLQEGLTNIHRHSGSDRAEVGLDCQPEKVVLRIRDYGRGMTPAQLENFERVQSGLGVGLAGMRERAAQLGGQLKISSDSSGMTVEVSVPLRFDPKGVEASQPVASEAGA